MIQWILAAICFVLAGFVFFSEVLGLFRFRYVLNRMHATALGDTMGIVLIILGTMILRGWSAVTLKLLLIPVFLFLTSPVLTHLLAEAEVLDNCRSNQNYREEDRFCPTGEEEEP